MIYSVWEYWLGKTKKTASASTIELIINAVSAAWALMKGKKMEKQMPAQPDKVVELGPVGKLELDFSKGLAHVKLTVAVPGAVGVEAGAFAQVDSVELIGALVGALEKKLPPGAVPIAEGVKAVLIEAVKSIP